MKVELATVAQECGSDILVRLVGDEIAQLGHGGSVMESVSRKNRPALDQSNPLRR